MYINSFIVSHKPYNYFPLYSFFFFSDLMISNDLCLSLQIVSSDSIVQAISFFISFTEYFSSIICSVLCHDFYLSVLCSGTQSCLALCNPLDGSLPGCSFHRDSPSRNTRVGCHFLLQEIFPTQGLNPGLILCC